MQKSYSWDFLIPGQCYPGRYEYTRQVSESIVRADLRRSLGVSRLPNGTDVYVLSREARAIISENYKKTAAEYSKAGQIADF